MLESLEIYIAFEILPTDCKTPSYKSNQSLPITWPGRSNASATFLGKPLVAKFVRICSKLVFVLDHFTGHR